MSLFKFSPTDAVLLCYLQAKINKEMLESIPIKDCQIYDFVPGKLPGLENVKDKTPEQYYFVPRERCKPKSSRPNRIVKEKRGTWKTNGNGEDIHDEEGRSIGHKQRLVFILNNDEKTPWIMHEYTLPSIFDQNKKEIFQKWVVCRITRNGRAKWLGDFEEVNRNGSIVSSNSEKSDANTNAQYINSKQLQQQQHYANVTSMEKIYNEEEFLKLDQAFEFRGECEFVRLD